MSWPTDPFTLCWLAILASISFAVVFAVLMTCIWMISTVIIELRDRMRHLDKEAAKKQSARASGKETPTGA